MSTHDRIAELPEPAPWCVRSKQLVGAGDGAGDGSSAPPPPPSSIANHHHPPALSVVDRVASPQSFVTTVLLFERALDPERLRAALACVVRLMPALACRAALDARGETCLSPAPPPGALLAAGDAPGVTLADLRPPPGARRWRYRDLGPWLFDAQRLARSTVDPAVDAAAAAATPLFALALVELSCGGCVLGARAAHLIADFGTISAALGHLAAAYSEISGGDGSGGNGGSSNGVDAGAAPPPPPPLPTPRPGAPALAALAAAGQPLPGGFEPFNYIAIDGDWVARVGRPVFNLGSMRAVAYHVPPARLAALKARALADLAAAAAAEGGAAAAEGGGAGAGTSISGAADDPAALRAGSTCSSADGGDGGEGGGAAAPAQAPWVSTHDALVAHMWLALAALPTRLSRGNATPLTLALDMRRRMDPGACGVPLEEQGALCGNLATTALAPAADVARGGPGGGPMALGAVARLVRAAVPRSAARFAGDVAFLAREDAAAGLAGKRIILPVWQIAEDTAAGRTPLLMTSAWRLDFAALRFAGAAPAAAAPALAIGFPLVVLMPAAPAAGGGWLVHVWLPPAEADELERCVREL